MVVSDVRCHRPTWSTARLRLFEINNMSISESKQVFLCPIRAQPMLIKMLFDSESMFTFQSIR